MRQLLRCAVVTDPPAGLPPDVEARYPIGVLIARTGAVRHVAVYRGAEPWPLCNHPGDYVHHGWSAYYGQRWCRVCITMSELINARVTGGDRRGRAATRARAEQAEDALRAIAGLLTAPPVGAASRSGFIRIDRLRALIPAWLADEMAWDGPPGQVPSQT